MKKLVSLLVAFVMLIGLLGCQSSAPAPAPASSSSGTSASATSAQTYTIRYCSDNNPGSFEDKAVHAFKDAIEEKSDGAITVEVYTSGQLGEGTNLAELVQMGGTDMLFISTSNVASIIPELGIFDIPFLQPGSQAEAYKVLHNGKMFDYIYDMYAEKGITLLDIVPLGIPAWTGNKLFKAPNDFTGFKMRIMASPLLQAQYDSYGANPVNVAYSELYSALQLGIADGQCNSAYVSYNNKFYEVQSCITLPNSSISCTSVAANPAWWGSLPTDIQDLIRECVGIQAQFHFENYSANDKIAVDTFKGAGCEVYVLTEEEREVFRQVSMPVRDTYVKIVGTKGQVMLDLYAEDYKAVMG